MYTDPDCVGAYTFAVTLLPVGTPSTMLPAKAPSAGEAAGVTVAGADEAPTPTALDAVTTHVYETPFERP